MDSVPRASQLLVVVSTNRFLSFLETHYIVSTPVQQNRHGTHEPTQVLFNYCSPTNTKNHCRLCHLSVVFASASSIDDHLTKAWHFNPADSTLVSPFVRTCYAVASGPTVSVYLLGPPLNQRPPSRRTFMSVLSSFSPPLLCLFGQLTMSAEVHRGHLEGNPQCRTWLRQGFQQWQSGCSGVEYYAIQWESPCFISHLFHCTKTAVKEHGSPYCDVIIILVVLVPVEDSLLLFFYLFFT